jgi:23S rRNA (uridine2552-2'-O)-methyltransferase
MRDRHDHYFRKAKTEGYLSRAAYKLMEIDDRRKILHPGDWVLDCGCWPGGWLQVASERVGPRGAVIGIDFEPVRHQFQQSNVRTIQADLRSVDAGTLLGLAAEASGARGAAGSVADRARPASSSTIAGAIVASDAASSGNADHVDADPSARDSARRFDVILSDMAPKTSGDHTVDHHASARLCDLVLSICPALLRPGGSLVMKIFEGERYPDLLAQCRTTFNAVKGFKPKSSRSESREMYIIAQDYAGGPEREPSPPQRTGATMDSPPPRPQPRPGW